MHTRAAWHAGRVLKLSPVERLILVYLTDRAHPDGTWADSQERIAAFVGVSDRAIRTSLKTLLRLGLIEVVRRGHRRGEHAASTVYRVLIVQPEAASGRVANRKHASGRESPQPEAASAPTGSTLPASVPRSVPRTDGHASSVARPSGRQVPPRAGDGRASPGATPAQRADPLAPLNGEESEVVFRKLRAKFGFKGTAVQRADEPVDEDEARARLKAQADAMASPDERAQAVADIGQLVQDSPPPPETDAETDPPGGG